MKLSEVIQKRRAMRLYQEGATLNTENGKILY